MQGLFLYLAHQYFPVTSESWRTNFQNFKKLTSFCILMAAAATWRQDIFYLSLLQATRKLTEFLTDHLSYCINWSHDKWVPVTMAWLVLRFRREERPPVWSVAANILNKKSRTGDNMWSSTFGAGRWANKTLRKKNCLITKWIHVPRAWTDPLVRTKQWKGKN